MMSRDQFLPSNERVRCRNTVNFRFRVFEHADIDLTVNFPLLFIVIVFHLI